MRVLSSIIFLFIVPFVIFTATIFYGGISSSELKQELIQSSFYPAVTAQIKGFVQNPNNGDPQDSTASLITSMLLQQVTPEYVQGKTEKIIDDTGSWVQGKTTTPPVVSFPELTQNLTLLSDMQSIINQLQQQSSEASSDPATVKQITTLNKQIDSLKSFMKTGLTIPVWKNLVVLKQAYQILKILFPIMIVLVLLSLWGIIYFNKTKTAKFRWVGIVLFISAVSGYALLFIGTLLASVGEQMTLGNQNKFVQILSPVAIKMISYFINQYRYYQTIVSISFICIGVICFILSFKYASQTPVGKQ